MPIKEIHVLFQLAQLQMELQRMNIENQRLKDMLGQVSNNYSVLHNHLVTLMQQQQTHGADSAQENEVTTTTTPNKNG